MLSPIDRILLLTHRIQEDIKMKNTLCFFQFPGQYELIHKQAQLDVVAGLGGRNKISKLGGAELGRRAPGSLPLHLTPVAPSQSLNARVASGFKKL